MILVLFYARRLDQDIINEHHYKLIKKRLEDSVHKVHEHRWSIGQPKRHHQELIVTISCSESYLCHISFTDPDLMVTGPQVNLREHLSILQLVKQVIYPWQRIFVF